MRRRRWKGAGRGRCGDCGALVYYYIGPSSGTETAFNMIESGVGEPKLAPHYRNCKATKPLPGLT